MLTINPSFAVDSIVFNMHDLLFLTNLSWDIVTVNPAVQSLLGHKPESLEGESLAKLVPAATMERWKALERRRKDSGEAALATILGESIPVSYVIQNVHDKCDDPVGYLLFARDIREMKRLEKLTKELQQTNEKLALMSITDSLTQVYNRQKIEREIEVELDRFRRYATVFSIIMFDLDFFKEVNDEHGHDVGDKVLIELTKVVQTEIRSTDLLARWGGEEFVVLCPGIRVENVAQQADRIRRQIEEHAFGIIETMTVSFGVTEVKESDTIDSLMKRADVALYKAKESGRNRVNQI
jgi:diguanylate cyclase (GGDEF)-like protein/PAS domain S-box-containing protein